MKIFYLNCPIGFEKLLLKELNYKWSLYFLDQPLEIIKEDKGGVEISCELQFGLALNYILKIPTRIILRIKEQKCRDLPKLFNILKKIDWKCYLQQYNVEFSVSCTKSRLIHTKRIEETAIDALKAFFNANKIPEKNLLQSERNQLILLRFYDDDLSISLDTSGELLHKRTLSSSYRGHASIRENYASSLLLFLLGLNDYSHFSLIDPMCGSATFLLEARDFMKLSKRCFSFENWKDFSAETLKNIKITSEDIPHLWNFKNLLGNELDKSVVAKLDYEEIEIKEGDFFSFNYKNSCMLILNPPYGKKIKIDGDKHKYFRRLITVVKNNIKPKSFGLIIPEQFSRGISSKKQLRFNQNGIKVIFHVF